MAKKNAPPPLGIKPRFPGPSARSRLTELLAMKEVSLTITQNFNEEYKLKII